MEKKNKEKNQEKRITLIIEGFEEALAEICEYYRCPKSEAIRRLILREARAIRVELEKERKQKDV